MAAERLDGLLLFAQESDYLADRLRQLRLLLLPVPLCRRRRAHGAADPLGRSAPGPAHLEPRGHPHLARRRGRRSHPRSQGDARRSRRRAAPRRRIRQLRPDPFQRPPARGGARRAARRWSTSPASFRACARPSRPRNSSTSARPRGSPTSPTAPAIEATRAGADEGEILAAMHHAIFAAGGDYPANEFIIGSGADALLCRYKSGRRRLDADDQLTLEFAGVSRHYHAAIMRTHVVGRERPLHRPYHAAAREALEACAAELRPGTDRGRRVRRPRARSRRARPFAASPERLRLQPRRQVHAVVDGRADVLRGQSVRNRRRIRSISCT